MFLTLTQGVDMEFTRREDEFDDVLDTYGRAARFMPAAPPGTSAVALCTLFVSPGDVEGYWLPVTESGEYFLPFTSLSVGDARSSELPVMDPNKPLSLRHTALAALESRLDHPTVFPAILGGKDPLHPRKREIVGSFSYHHEGSRYRVLCTTSEIQGPFDSIGGEYPMTRFTREGLFEELGVYNNYTRAAMNQVYYDALQRRKRANQ